MKVILFSLIFFLVNVNVFSQCSVQAQMQYGDCNGQCAGTAFSTATGISPFVTEWSNGDIGSNADSLCGDSSYIVTIIDALGCIAYDTLIMPSAFIISFHNITNVSCLGCCDGTDSIVMAQNQTPLCGPFLYQWSGDPWPSSQNYRNNLCAGTYTVLVSNNCCAWTTISNVGNTTTSIKESPETKSGLIDVFPNPFSGSTTFSFSNEEFYEFKISDASGKVIGEKEFRGKQFLYENANLQSGIYFYEWKDSNGKMARGKLFYEER